MKHLISLALKYIRRQKLRSVLTFMCVTLSAFILCSFGAYLGSIVKTMENEEIRQFGSYEADITEWIYQSEDRAKALDIISDHAAVSDHCAYYQEYFNYIYTNNKPEPDGRFSFAEFSDGKNTARVKILAYESTSGNPDLYKRYDSYYAVESNLYTGELEKGEFLVPSWIKDMGYSEGDTITFTLRNVNAAYDEESEIVRAARREHLENGGSSMFADDLGYSELEHEEKQKASRQTLAKYLENEKNIAFKDVPTADEIYGDSFEYTLKIAGFIDNEDAYLYIYGNNGFTPLFDNMSPQSDADVTGSRSAYVRINENLDIEEGLHMLFEDLGFSSGDYDMYQPLTNDFLLLLEFRMSSGIAVYIPTLALIAVVVLLIWLLARFVIDNAFEISAKERSTQYAALRVLGTSKSQIAALVFTEAVFYMLTAVPTGAALAYLACNSTVSSLRNLGLEDFEFSFNPYIAAISIILCVLAIFISAYTSAMWAARKLSPAEALSFGKPKSKNKVRRHKSKLKLGSKRFLMRYIVKNIMRSKSRYIISTITMTLGVFLFTFVMMIGIYVGTELKNSYGHGNIDPDFTCMSYDNLCVDEIDEKFRGGDLFSKVEAEGVSVSHFGNGSNEDKFREFIKSVSFYDVDNFNNMVTFVDVDYFNENLAETLGMTYDEFSALDGVIFNQSVLEPRNENGEQPAHEECYVEFSESEAYTEKDNDGKEMKIIGTVCSSKGDHGFIASINSETANKFCSFVWLRLNVNGSENYEEAENTLMEFVDKYNFSDVSNNYIFATGMSEFIKAIVKMVLTLISAIWTVGMLSMVNSINTGVLNRSKELLMLRSVGMTRRQLKGTVILESMMFSALSSILGILLAAGSYMIFMQSFGEKISFAGMTGVILISALVNILIAAAAAVPGIRNLEKAESLVKFAN